MSNFDVLFKLLSVVVVVVIEVSNLSCNRFSYVPFCFCCCNLEAEIETCTVACNGLLLIGLPEASSVVTDLFKKVK